MKVKANNFTIFWGGAAIAYATTAELDVSADVKETGRTTAGAWCNYLPGRKGWTISAGHLFDVRGKDTVEAEGGVYRNAFEMLTAGAEVTVAFGTIDDHAEKLAKDQQLNNKIKYTGSVLVRRFTVSAVKGQFATCQFEAVGVGELTETRV